MLLAPISRTLCFALTCSGILLVCMELACWWLAPRVDPAASQGSMRALERRLLAFTLGSRLLPWAISLFLLTPAYLRAEDNPYAENVSLYCIAASLIVALWLAITLVRALVLAWRTRKYCRASKASELTIAGRALMLHRGSHSLIAVAGILRTRLIVSEKLLEDESVSTSALKIALDHELSHAQHRDNLKLLLFAALPSLPFSSKAIDTLETRWRLAAELAADEEATGRDSARSLALADLLVQLARRQASPNMPSLATLLSAPRHLAIRVDHLLAASQHASLPASAQVSRSAWRVLALFGAVAVTSLSLMFGHEAAEFLLHLGS